MQRAYQFLAKIEPHIPRLLSIGQRLSGSLSDAEDLVQESLLKAWTFWESYEPEVPVAAWLSKILRNTAISRYRRMKVARIAAERFELAEFFFDPGSISAARSPEHQWLLPSISEEASDALAQLPEAFRQVVEFVDLEGLSYHEAASRMGCPPGTVMSRLHRARKLLRHSLRDYAASCGFGRNPRVSCNRNQVHPD